MFKKLFGRNRPKPARHKVWLRGDAKAAEVERLISEAVDPSQMTVMITHFADTETHLQRVTNSLGIEVERIDQLVTREKLEELRESPRPFVLLHARHLESLIEDPDAPRVKATADTRVIVVQLHPVRRYAPEIELTAHLLGVDDGPEYLVSIDDPTMSLFAGESTRRALQSLGMKDDESITHSWIDKSIVRAHEKIEANARHVGETPNCTRWLIEAGVVAGDVQIEPPPPGALP